MASPCGGAPLGRGEDMSRIRHSFGDGTPPPACSGGVCEGWRSPRTPASDLQTPLLYICDDSIGERMGGPLATTVCVVLCACADGLWVCVANCVWVCLLSGAVVAAASVQVCSAGAQRG